MPINRVTIVGNLTRDPELRGLPSGGSVCSLRVAVNERRKNGQTGQWDDVPNFFNVTVFGNSADATAKFLTKGRQVAVELLQRVQRLRDLGLDQAAHFQHASADGRQFGVELGRKVFVAHRVPLINRNGR